VTTRDDYPELDTARGGYVGPISREKALDAIRAHTTGPVILEYPENGFAGGERKFADGWCNEVGDLAPTRPVGPGVFAFFRGADIPLEVGMLYPEATVLDLSGDEWTAEQWTGGLDIRMGDSLVRLVFWHEVLHVTDSGDVAPGFGFEVKPDDANEEG
jgi:hypothetical protein